MILELRNKKPFINFGFNRIKESVFVGEVVNVWLNTLYNETSYPIRGISAPDATVTRINNYHYALTYNSSGNKTIQLEVQDEPKKLVLMSNVLNIEVKTYKADTNKLTADTTLITADYF